MGLCTRCLDEAAEMAHLVRVKSLPLWRVPQRYWLQSHSGEDWGWRDMLCSQGRAKAGSHHYNLLNINKIQKYSHKK